MIEHTRDDEPGLDPQAQVLLEQLRAVASVARAQLSEGGRRVQRFVVEKPLQALGIALGVGVLIGWMIKRR